MRRAEALKRVPRLPCALLSVPELDAFVWQDRKDHYQRRHVEEPDLLLVSGRASQVESYAIAYAIALGR